MVRSNNLLCRDISSVPHQPQSESLASVPQEMVEQSVLVGVEMTHETATNNPSFHCVLTRRNPSESRRAKKSEQSE